MSDEELEIGAGEEIEDEATGSLSEDISAAWDASEDEGDAPREDREPDSETGGTVAREDNNDDGGVAPGVGSSGNGPRPPLDWTPELREEWAGLPEGVRNQIASREAQMATAMQGTAQARQIAQDFSGVANKYGSVMAAEGIPNPLQMVETLLSTVSELRMGSPQQKAQRMAELIQHYGIDISSLDDSLSSVVGGQPQQNQQPQVDPNLEYMLDQRMAPVNEMMQQLAGMQQQRNQQGHMEARQEVDAFAQNAEFLNDVRHDVADLIDMATRQGRDMPLQEAYDKACAMNPQIAQVLEQRAQQQSLADAGRNVRNKRAAASSLAPGNAGSNSKAVPDTLLGQLNAAWDEQLG